MWIYMKPTRSKKMQVMQLSGSPAILDAVRSVFFRPSPRRWLPRPNNRSPPYDEFVGVMWHMPHLTGLYVDAIGDLPASLADFIINTRTLRELNLFNLTIPPSTFRLQIPLRGFTSIRAAAITGSIEQLFSNSISTLQRIDIGSLFPMDILSYISRSSTSTFSSLVMLSIGKPLTLEESSCVCRLLPCCPVLETLNIHSKFPSPMSTIPPETLPRLRSLKADEDGHALVLLDSPVRRVSDLTLTLQGPSMFRSLQGLQSQPIHISGEIAYACLTTPNDDFSRLILNCERFSYVTVASENPVTEVRGRSP
jgi:hypothetical protein